jgi:hypothetical protein
MQKSVSPFHSGVTLSGISSMATRLCSAASNPLHARAPLASLRSPALDDLKKRRHGMDPA